MRKLMLMYLTCTLLSIPAIPKWGIADDSVYFGMRIEEHISDRDAFRIETTGSSFVYSGKSSSLRAYQKLLAERLVFNLTFQKSPGVFELSQGHPDCISYKSEALEFCLYSDSTILIQCKQGFIDFDLNIGFAPEYIGRKKNRSIWMDQFGGVAVLPENADSRVNVLTAALNQPGNSIRGRLDSGQRLMFSVFPPRDYPESQIHQLRIVHTAGVTDQNDVSTGLLPPDEVIEKWSRYANVIAIQGSGLYPGYKIFGKNYRFPERQPGSASFCGPYIPKLPEELLRVLEKAHSLGMRVILYTSAFYHYAVPDARVYLDDVRHLVENYDIDGIYVDGLYKEKKFKGGGVPDNPILNWQIMRKLREIVGPDRIIYYHGTGDRSGLSALPNIDAYCDIVLYGEDVPINSLESDYVKFIVRKKGISNTIGMIKPNLLDESISMDQIADKMLAIGNTMRFLAYPRRTASGFWEWPTKPPDYLKYLYDKLKNRRLRQWRPDLRIMK